MTPTNLSYPPPPTARPMAQPLPPQPQAQQKSPDRDLQTPLQILPAMLHAVFCQTADVFNAPQRQQPRAVIYTNAQIRTSVSACNERFQYALDLLEMDILKAKATLRRDLSEIRAVAAAEAAHKQALEEAALAAERARQEALLQQQRQAAEAQKQREAAAAAAAAEEQQRLLQQQLQLQQQQQQAQLQLQHQQEDTHMNDAPNTDKLFSPTNDSSTGFDFLFDELPASAPPAPVGASALAPAAQMQEGGGANNGDAAAVSGGTSTFDDFLASLAPVGGDHEGVDGGMGGGQPLGEAGLFGSEFDDLFCYGGT